MPKIQSMQELEAFFTSPEMTKKKFPLKDGRTLSYSQAGQVDGTAPVLFQIGLMASSLSVVAFHEEAKRLGLHLIALDYPGIGESTLVPDRTLQQWPLDVLEFCQGTLLEAYEGHYIGLMAHSMGAPHALALLDHKEMSQRIHRVTLVSPWLPFGNEDGNDSNVSKSTNHQNVREHSQNLTSPSSPPIPWFLGVARSLPDMMQSRVLPYAATTFSTSSLALAGSVASCQKNFQAKAIQLVTEYARLQGQEGNKQMVGLALKPLFVPTRFLREDLVITIFWGTTDALVKKESCLKLMDDCWKDREITFHIVEGASHNSIMATPHLSKILKTMLIS